MPDRMSIARFTRALRDDRRGVTAITFALSAIILLTFVGMAIDGSRWFTARRQHGAAIDAALLSAARQLQFDASAIETAMATASSVYSVNMPKGVTTSVVFVQDAATQTVTFTGEAYIPTTLLRVAGLSQLLVSAPATARYSQSGQNGGSNIEIAVMLDVTGSMCDDGMGPCTTGTKISGVKQAATDLAKIVLGTQSTTFASRIALVPYSSAVRIDADGSSNPLMQVLTGLPQTYSYWTTIASDCTGSAGYYVGEVWVAGTGTCSTITPIYNSNQILIPCVTERTFNTGIGFDAGDSAPGSDNWLLGHSGDRSGLSFDSSNKPMTSYTGLTQSDPSYTWNYTVDGSGCKSRPGNVILPLTSNLTDVTDRIQALDAFGPTAGALGTVWTQYMLSPNWSSIWSSSQRPGSYSDTQTKQANGAPVLRKVAILMTDGGYNSSRQYVEPTPTYMQTISDRAISVCANMKKNGIEIFTVAFDMASLGDAEAGIAKSTLQSCGTDISHFYNSQTVSDLQGAFRDIALKVSPIRLSQ